MPRVRVGRNDGVELQHPEAARPALHKAVRHQLFADMQPARGPLDGVAGVADVAAAADVVWVQDIKAIDRSGIRVHRGGGIGLCGEEGRAGLGGQKLLLREGHAVFHDLVPDAHERGKVLRSVFSDDQLRMLALFLPSGPAV